MNHTKECNKCKRDLPATPDYFWKDKKTDDGLWRTCIECKGGKFRKLSKKSGYKICTKCEEEKVGNLEYFTPDKKGKLGLSSVCRECKRKDSLQNYYNNHEENLRKGREYYEQNREEIRIRWKKHYEENKEKINAWHREHKKKNREKYREQNRKHRENNKELYRNYCQKRLALKRSLPATLTNKQWEGIMKSFNYKCCYCGEEKDLTREHFVPLSEGGEFTKDNIIPSCLSCNSSKGNKDFFEWYPQQEFYSTERMKRILKHLGYKELNEETFLQQLSLL